MASLASLEAIGQFLDAVEAGAAARAGRWALIAMLMVVLTFTEENLKRTRRH